MADPRIWFDPPAFSWGRVIRIGLLWLAVVLALALPTMPGREDEAGKAPRRDATLSTPVEPAVLPASAPRIAATDSPPAAAPPAASAVVAAVRELEVCGGKRLKMGADSASGMAALKQVDTRELRQRSLSAMRASGTELARAGALLLEGAASGGVSSGLQSASLDTLANLAAASEDPKLYGLAFRACAAQKRSPRSGCQLLSADQWSRLDPDNAVPWLFVAAQAQQRKDASGVHEAMDQVARARRSDDGASVLPALLLQHAPREDAALLPTVQLLVEAIGIQAAWTLPTNGMARDFCADNALRDPLRKQTCNDIAEVLVNRSTGLVEHAAGTAIGRRVGWTDERLRTLQNEREAIAEVMNRALAADNDVFSCAWARRNLAHFRSVAEHGELEAGRLAIRQSGKEGEQFAKAFRERSDKAASPAR